MEKNQEQKQRNFCVAYKTKLYKCNTNHITSTKLMQYVQWVIMKESTIYRPILNMAATN